MYKVLKQKNLLTSELMHIMKHMSSFDFDSYMVYTDLILINMKNVGCLENMIKIIETKYVGLITKTLYNLLEITIFS